MTTCKVTYRDPGTVEGYTRTITVTHEDWDCERLEREARDLVPDCGHILDIDCR